MSGAREWLTRVRRKLTGSTSYEDAAKSWNGDFVLAKETIIRWATHEVSELQRHGAADALVDSLTDQSRLREGFSADRSALIGFLDPLMVNASPWKPLLGLLLETGDEFIAQALKYLKRDSASVRELLEAQSQVESEIAVALQITEAAERDEKLLPLYTEASDLTRKLLERADVEAERKEKLTALVTAGKHRQNQIDEALATTRVHAHAAQATKKQHEETLLPSLTSLRDERADIDRKLSELENVKLRLKVELDRISQEIAQVMDVQRNLMAKEEAVNREIDAVKISTAQALNADCDKEEILRVESRAKTETISVLHEFLKTNDADKHLIEIRALADAAEAVASAAVDRHALSLVARAGDAQKDGNLVEDVRKLVGKFSLRFLSDERKRELQNLV